MSNPDVFTLLSLPGSKAFSTLTDTPESHGDGSFGLNSPVQGARRGGSRTRLLQSNAENVAGKPVQLQIQGSSGE